MLKLTLTKSNLDFLNSSISVIGYTVLSKNLNYYKENLRFSKYIMSIRKTTITDPIDKARLTFLDQVREKVDQETGKTYEYRVMSDEKQSEWKEYSSKFLDETVDIEIKETYINALKRYVLSYLSLTPIEQNGLFQIGKGVDSTKYLVGLNDIMDCIQEQLPEIYNEVEPEATKIAEEALAKEQKEFDEVRSRRSENMNTEVAKDEKTLL